MPAVLCGRHQWKGAARRNGGKALVFRPVTAADIHLAAFGDNHYRRTNRSRFIRRGLFRCVRLTVIIRNSVHQRCMRLVAVLAVRIQTGFLLERQQRLATAANGWNAVVIGSKVGWVSGKYSRII